MRTNTKRLIGVVAAAAIGLTVSNAAGALTGPWGGTSGTACSTCVPTTTRVSANTAGGDPELFADAPSISGDGRFAVFTSAADNLVAGDNHSQTDVFVRDLMNKTTDIVSLTSEGYFTSSDSGQPKIASGGRFVIFATKQSRMTPDFVNPTGEFAQIYRRDFVFDETILVSKSSTGSPAATGATGQADISAAGRFIAFKSGATNLVDGDTNNSPDIFLRDVVNGTTIRVSVTTSGAQMGSGRASAPSISADGRFVAFESNAALDPADTNGEEDVYVWDATTGRTTPVSVNAGGTFGSNDSVSPNISDDGRKIAFETISALDPSDTNGVQDVYVRTLGTTELVRASLGANNAQGNADSSTASLSTTGDVVSFISSATNLVGGDTNGVPDVFVRRLTSGTTSRASVSTGGVQTDRAVTDVDLAGNGSVVVFQSAATNLVSGDAHRPSPADEIFGRTL